MQADQKLAVGQGSTALILAAYNGEDAVVEALLKHGADVRIADDEARPKAFYIAACMSSAEKSTSKYMQLWLLS